MLSESLCSDLLGFPATGNVSWSSAVQLVQTSAGNGPGEKSDCCTTVTQQKVSRWSEYN